MKSFSGRFGLKKILGCFVAGCSLFVSAGIHGENVFVQAGKYESEGRYQEAVELYEKCIKEDSGNARLYNNAGFVYYKISRYDRAEEYFKKAIKLDPFYAFAHNNLGIVHYLNGDLDKAEFYFNIALKINQKYSKAMVNLSKVYFKKGKYFDATAAYLNAFNMDREGVKKIANPERIVEKLQEEAKKNPDNKELKEFVDLVIAKKDYILKKYAVE